MVSARQLPATEGWTELAATNAPVADEPVEAVFRMNENPILPTWIFFFFPPLLYPKIFPPPTSPLLPTTYQPLPPHSIARAPETLNKSELGAWSRLGAGASLELGAAGAGPTQDPGKHFFLCLFCLFVCGVALHKIRSIAVQLHKQHLLLLLLFCAMQEVPKNKRSELGAASFCFPVFPFLPPCSSSFFLASSFFILFLLAPLCFFFSSCFFLLFLLLFGFFSSLPPPSLRFISFLFFSSLPPSLRFFFLPVFFFSLPPSSLRFF